MSKHSKSKNKVFVKDKSKKKVLVIASVAVVTVVATLVTLWALGVFDFAKDTSSPLITLSQYEQIERGMSLDEVIKVFKGEGTVESEAGEIGSPDHTAQYIWDGVNPGSRATILFSGGVVATFTQIGLTD